MVLLVTLSITHALKAIPVKLAKFSMRTNFFLLSTTYLATFQKISPVRMEAPPTQNLAFGGEGELKNSRLHIPDSN